MAYQVLVERAAEKDLRKISSEVFAGNTTDVSTVEDMVEMMEKKYGQAQRIWVMDRGMVSEDNLDFLRERQARCIVGTPKQQMRRFEAQLLDQSDWAEVQPGVEVKLVEHPDGESREQYVLCRSSERRQKEAAMLEQQRQRLRTQLQKIDAGLRKRPALDIGKIGCRIGRLLGKYPGAERLIEVTVQRDAEGRASGLSIVEKSERQSWAELAHGAYLLRTNCTEQDPAQFWRWYIHLTQAEECFKI